jgi:hypothetical protein
MNNIDSDIFIYNIAKYIDCNIIIHLKNINKKFNTIMKIPEYNNYIHQLFPIQYNIYKNENDGNRINFNWVRKYTYGSVFLRGTSVSLKKCCGEFIINNNYHPDNLFIYPTEFTDEIMFWDDDGFRAKSIDDLLNDLYISEYLLHLNEINNISSAFESHYYENYNYNSYISVDYNIVEEILNKNIHNIETIYMEYDTICFIYKYKELIQELKQVNEICKKNNITFFWL